MYPPDIGTWNIEIHCCNLIYECVENTFLLTVTDTTPTLDPLIFVSNQIIQYDVADNVGQFFTWAMTSTVFADADQVTGDSTLDYYNHQSHTIWTTLLTQTYTGFRSIKWIGMFFGQGYNNGLTNLGSNILTFQYQDLYSRNAIVTNTMTIYVNRRPYLTTTGTSYSFSTIDPSAYTITNFFDKYFPFIKDDFGNVFVAQIAPWFYDYDGHTMTYDMSYSDATDRPAWIGFDYNSGEMRGYPMQKDGSELINLRISAVDTKEGVNYYMKTLLVNSYPNTTISYKTITLGLNRKVGVKLAKYFRDFDGDYLTYSMPNSDEITKINTYGL